MLFGLGVVASLSVLTSCKKDEVVPEGPKITFANGATYEANVKDTLHTFIVNADAAGELKEIKVFDVSDSKNEIQLGATITKFSSDTKHTFNQTVNLFDINGKRKTGEVKIKVSVTDKKDQTNSSTFTIKTYVFIDDLNSYTAVLMGGQTNYSGTYGCFYASTKNLAYNLNDAKLNSGLVDFIYAYGPNYKAHLAAPSDKVMKDGLAANLSVKNTTTITKTLLKVSDFDAISKSSDLSTISLGTDTYANLLAVGDIVAFKTGLGKIGLVKIIEINMSDNGTTDVEKYGNGTMKIQVKVQK